MNCPKCQTEHSKIDCECAKCGFGLAARPIARKHWTSTVDGSLAESRDENLSRTFRCPSCQSHGGIVKHIVTTGAGVSTFLEFQGHEFITVSCTYCGAVQLYDAAILEKRFTDASKADGEAS